MIAKGVCVWLTLVGTENLDYLWPFPIPFRGSLWSRSPLGTIIGSTLVDRIATRVKSLLHLHTHTHTLQIFIPLAFQYKCVLLVSFNFPNGLRSISILQFFFRRLNFFVASILHLLLLTPSSTWSIVFNSESKPHRNRLAS